MLFASNSNQTITMSSVGCAATGRVTTERTSESRARLEPKTPATSVTRFNDGATWIPGSYKLVVLIKLVFLHMITNFSSALYGWKKPSAHIVLKLTPQSKDEMLFDGFSTMISKCKTQHDWLHYVLLHSWPFSRYSAPIYWLVHGHMKSNNETVFRQMPRVGNIAKTIVHCYVAGVFPATVRPFIG